MLDLMNFLFLGLVAGLLVVSWQCFKDPPWEGFSLKKFSRSFIISTIIATFLYILALNKIIIETNAGIILLTIICIERAIGEVYKGFIKKEHEEYNKVLLHYHIKINSHAAKILLGVGLALSITALFLLYIQIANLVDKFTPNKIIQGSILGLIAGFSVAAGGALKDTTFEKFNPIKFLRSPLVGLIGGILLINISQYTQILVLACIGFERVVCECYKTFIRRKTRGIFENKTVLFKKWLALRWIFIHTYALGLYILLIKLFY